MPAKRRPRKADNGLQVDAIATVDLSAPERLAALGTSGKQINALLKDNDWRRALQKGATAVDALALKHLFQLVSGDFEVVEDRFPIRDESGNITGTRKITRPGPSFQACRYWLELRASDEGSAKSSAAMSTKGVPLAESKQQVMSSILALINPKDDPMIKRVEPEAEY